MLEARQTLATSSEAKGKTNLHRIGKPHWGNIGVMLGIYRDYIGVILGIYRDYIGVTLGIYRDYIGVISG